MKYKDVKIIVKLLEDEWELEEINKLLHKSKKIKDFEGLRN